MKVLRKLHKDLEAMEFTGDNGPEVLQWILCRNPLEDVVINSHTLSWDYGSYWEDVFPGDMIVCDESDSFSIEIKERFNQLYENIEEEVV